MTVTSGFFNSVGDDRLYSAEDFGRLFDGIMEDGVHKGIGTDFAVTSAGGNILNVGAGRAWFNRTWIRNDSPITVNATASNPGLPRIDAVVIEIDTSTAVRAASIKYKAGVAASLPVAPTMTHTETLNEYALCYISRPANASSITFAQITNLVGTPACPYAASRLLDRSFEPSWMHRATFRGKNLGASLTPSQLVNIRNGSFDDLYVGDFWEINGVKWRIADINYFLNKGPYTLPTVDDRVKKPHLVIVPDSSLLEATMYTSRNSNNSGGYWTSRRTIFLIIARETILNAFFPGGSVDDPNSPIMPFYDQYTTSYSNGRVPASAWERTHIELMTTPMVAGAPWFYSPGDGMGLPSYTISVGLNQLALFDLAPWYLSVDNLNGNQFRFWWLRDIASAQSFVKMGSGGDLSFSYSDVMHGIRPFFLLG